MTNSMRYTDEYKRFLLTTNRPEVRLLKLKKLAGEPVDINDMKEVRFGELTETEVNNLSNFMLSLSENLSIKLLLRILDVDYKKDNNSETNKKAEKFLARKEFSNFREVIFKAADDAR